MADARSLAVFCDFENIALGVREARYSQFDMEKVLERLLAKGSIVVKRRIATGIATRSSRPRCTPPRSS